MKYLWHYMCDFGHEWEFIKDTGDEDGDGEDEPECPYGHAAVTLQKRRLIYQLEISIINAAQEIDSKSKMLFARDLCKGKKLDR
jgi:hypothetical protein